MTVKRYANYGVDMIEKDQGDYVRHEEYTELQRQLTAYEATVANLTAQVQGLAVENAQMLRLLTDISENHGEFVNEDDDYMYASVPLDYVSEINMYVSRDVNAENPFEHTDAALAEIRNDARAEGVDGLSKFLYLRANELVREGSNRKMVVITRTAARLADDYAKKLRGSSDEQ